MAYKTLSDLKGFLKENEDVSDRDVETEWEKEEDIVQLIKGGPNLEEIFLEQNVQSDLQEAVNSHGVTSDSTCFTSNRGVGEPTCFSCAKKCKLKSGHDIKLGMHLLHGRYLPANKVNDAINKAFSFVSQKVGSEQPFLYEHHAIVSEVIETSDKTATVKVVEFTSLGSFTYGVIESDKPFVINVETDGHISYRQYGELRYTPDEIVERARSCKGESAYNLITNNCEHVAVWCVSGEKESFQAAETSDQKFRQIFTWIGSMLGKITQFMVSDGVAFGSRVAKFATLAIPCIAFAGVFFLLELIISILRFVELRKQKKSGLICHACYNKRKTYLIAKITCSVIASIVLSLIPMASKAHLAIWAIVLGIAATFILPSLVSYLYRKVKTVLNPLYEIPKMIVRKHEHIKPGDVLTIPKDHDIIIKNVKLLTRNEASGYVHLEVVHFTFPGPMSTRVVEKEKIPFEINEDMLNVFEFPSSAVYPDDEVVRNALGKVGDKNFNALFYRSSHMAKFCKVRDYFEDYWLSFSKVKTSERKVKNANDVKPGDMINFRYFGLPHIGIVAEKHPPADVVEIEFYHVERGIATQSKQKFDLDTNKILRHNYNESDRLPIEETIEKVENKIGEEVYPFRIYKASRLARDCVLKTGK